MLIQTPILETERLILRAHEQGDFERAVSLWADPIVTRFIGGKPATPQQTWDRLLKFRGLWQLLGFGYWAVIERATGLYVGDVGLADFKREMTPSISGLPEMGWVIRPECHGKGYATEALGAVVNWADTKLNQPKTVCIIAPLNSISFRVADKIGFIKKCDAVYEGAPTVLLERLRKQA